MKKGTLIVTGVLTLLIGALSLGAPTGAVSSFNSKEKGGITLSKDATHDGAYYAGATDITIDGTINGDLYCAGETVRITGTVKGDIICAAQKIVISGNVDQDVRLAAKLVSISGQVGGTLTSFAQDVELSKTATVAGDLNGAVQSLTIDGTVKQDLAMASQKLNISGVVEGSAAVAADSFNISGAPAIKGGLEYVGSSKQDFPAGAIVGPVKFTQAESSDSSSDAVAALVGFVLFMAATLVVASVVLVLIMPRYFERSYSVVRGKPSNTILIGIASALGLPLLAVVLAISGVGLILSILIVAALVMLHILAFPFAAYLLARALFGQVVHNAVLLMLAGAILLAILLLIPVVNIFVYMLLTVVGMGGLIVTLTSGYRKPDYSTKPAKPAAKK